MAINKVIYQGEVLIDLTEDTVTPETLAQGRRAHGKDGQVIIGTSTGEGGGGASITPIGGWEGTPLIGTWNGENMPTLEDCVNKIYFNTALSNEEIVNIFSNIEFPEPEVYEDGSSYTWINIIDSPIISENFEDKIGGIVYLDLEIGTQPNGEAVYCGYLTAIIRKEDNTSEVLFDDYIFYIGPTDDSWGVSFSGWHPDFSGTIEDCDICLVPPGAEGFFNGGLIDNQQEKYSSLFSLTPFVTVSGEPIQLSGEYDGTPIDLTEKEDIDIKVLLDEKKLPLKINFKLDTGSDKLQWKDYSNTVYTIQDDTCYILDCNEASVNLKGAPWQNENIKKVVILEGSHFIHTRMFENCTGLTEIIIPDSVTEIGQYAFNNCTGLIRIVIPNSVTLANGYNFNNCSNLIEIIAPAAMFASRQSQAIFQNLQKLTITTGDTFSNSAFSGCETLNEIELNVKSITSSAFSTCTGLSKVTLHNTITTIGNSAFYGCINLTEITIPDSVTSIGSSVFDGCEKLTNVTIPNSVTSIDAWAFDGCTSLTSIIIPDSVTSINDYTFNGCTNLTEVTCSANVLQNVVYSLKKIVKKITVTSGDTIANAAIQSCTSLTDLIISDSVQNVTSSMLYNCTSLANITGPAIIIPALTNVKATIETITITSGTTIPQKAFYTFNTKLKKISLPDSITTIGTQAFMYCSAKEINLPKSITRIETYTFSNCAVKRIVIPDTVQYIGDYAFYSSSSLEEVVLPNTNIEFGKWVFGVCRSLKNITLPDTTTKITNAMLRECESLTHLIIPDTVTSIESDGIRFCYNMKSISIPSSVSTIGSYALDGCRSLTSIVIPDGVTSIGDYVFNTCYSLKDIIISKSVSSIGLSVFPHSNDANLQNIFVDEHNSNYSDIDGILCSKDKTILYQYPCNKSNTIFTVPEAVSHIEQYAFSACGNLVELILPNSVKTIGQYAFSFCRNLTNVVLGTGLEIITENAFTGCATLDNIVLPDSITTIDVRGFAQCDNLTQITIPTSVTTINEDAFVWCSNLTSINYLGTIEQWNAITKQDDWDYLTGNYTIHCTDGDIAKA